MFGSQPGAPSRACHNCRRRRLRCDRSRPSCLKCRSIGQECLGYGIVLRWANGPAIRGKLAAQLVGQTLGQAAMTAASARGRGPRPALLDPLLNHLGRRMRHYFHHFATAVCGDLVSFDQQDRNPFRVIVPLTAQYDYLQAIVVATGAMHIAALRGHQDHPATQELVDALVAKDHAIRLLRSAVEAVTPATQPMVLSATVFLINLDRIDSGRGGWQAHIKAASTLMSSLQDPTCAMDQSILPLVDVIAADCLTYRVLGSAISGVAVSSEYGLVKFMSVLQRAEAYSYHCCPPAILQILLSASRISTASAASPEKLGTALDLVHQARSLDVVEWVHSIRGLAVDDDLDVRVSIACAHRATACLYIFLAVPEAAPNPAAVSMLVHEVLRHLAAVPIDHVHLKGTIWPTFVVGAQTDDPAQRAWCVERMQAVWPRNPWICPWGYVRTALETMQYLWGTRDRQPAGTERRNWLLELKSMQDKCLIV